MSSALEVIGRDLQAKKATYAVHDAVRQDLQVSPISYGWDSSNARQRSFPLTSPCRSVQAFYSVRPIWQEGPTEADTDASCLEQDLFDQDMLIVPLIIQNRPIGVLYLSDIEVEAKLRAESEVGAYAAILALLIEDNQLITIRAKKQSALVSLLHSTRSFMTAKDTSEILTGIVEEAARLTKAKIAVLVTHKPHAKDLKIEHSVGLPEAFLVASQHTLEGKELIKEVLSKRYLRINDVSEHSFEEPWYTLIKVSGISSFIGAVIPADTKLIRELLLFLDRGAEWTDEDTDLLLGFLNQSGIALTNADYFAELQKATRSAARSRDKLDLILDHIGESIFTIDRSRRIHSANRAFFETFKRTKSEVIGKMCYQVLGGEDEICPLCPAESVLDSGEVIGPQVLSFSGEDGTERQFEVFMYPITDDHGRVNQAIVAMRDIAALGRLVSG